MSLLGWLVLFGLIAITHSLQMRKQIADWPLSRGGLVLLAIGLLLALFPDAVALAAAWVLGILALLIGGGLLAFARLPPAARPDGSLITPAAVLG